MSFNPADQFKLKIKVLIGGIERQTTNATCHPGTFGILVKCFSKINA